MKKRFTSFFSAVVVACMAFAQTSGNVVYSWESPEGTVIESGGTATSVMGADDRANYPNAGYYSLCLNGKKANVADTEPSSNACRIVIALDEALQEGDSIYITAYRNKNADGKKASIYFLYENGTEVNDDKAFTNICADDAAEPTTHGYLVPAEAAGSKTITLSRNSASTNVFITKFVIVRQAAEEEVQTNYTDAIVNADLSTTDAWNTEGTKGIKDGMVKVGSQAVYDFSQTITLPAGQYKMTAKAVYRYGSDEQAEYDAIQAGTETHKTKLYAETATKKYEANVQNRNDGASDTDYAAGNGSVTINGKFVPNSSAAVQAWFDAGQYVNELVFNVYEDGQVKVGITTADGVAGDYTNIGAWTLTRLGDAVEEPVEPDTPDTPVAPALDGTYFSVAAATTTLEYERWYLLKSQGRNAYINELGTELRMKGAGELAAINTTDDNKGLFFKLGKGAAEGTYTIVSGNGNYFTIAGSSSAVSATAVDYIIGNVAEGVFYMQDPASSVVADANPAGGTFVGWGTTVPTSAGGNNCYQFMEVEFIDATAAEAIVKASSMLYDLQVAYGLVTDASKFSSNAPETSEGSLGALIDNNYGTFFHSAWSYTVEGAHHLQMEVSEPTESLFFYFKKRSQNNKNRPTDITIFGSNDGENFVEITNLNSGFPTDAAVVDYTSEIITASEAYKHFRFVVNATSTETAFFTFSEFYLFPGNQTIIDAIATSKALVEAGIGAENFDELKANFEAAYNKVQEDKFNKVFNTAIADAEAILAAASHAEVPALGQYSTIAYTEFEATLAALKNEATQENLEAINVAVAKFEATKCLPVFTINGVIDYAAGKSIYENAEGGLNFKVTDLADESMLWTFDMAETVVGVTEKVVVKNLATGNLFWGAPSIKVAETSEAIAEDGIFLFYTEGNGTEIHAQNNNQVVVRWADKAATSGSAWTFTYVGTTYDLYDLDAPDWADITTERIQNADFTADAGWVHSETGSYAHNSGSRVAEFYSGWGSLEQTAGSLVQEITLPAGEYRLTGKAFFRQNGGAMDNPEKSLGYMVAGENKVLVKTLGSVEGLAAYANSIAEAGNAFYTQGLYDNVLEFTLAEETTLNIGFECTFDEFRSWFIVGEVKLERAQPVPGALFPLFEAQAMEFCQYNSMAMYSLGGVMARWEALTGTILEIYEAISSGEKVLDAKVEATMDAMTAMTTELKAIDVFFNEVFNETKFYCYDLQDNSTAKADVVAAFQDVVSLAYNMGGVSTLAELQALNDTLNYASRQYMLNAIPNEGFSFDYTFLVEGVGNSKNGWTWTPADAAGWGGNFQYQNNNAADTETLKKQGYVEVWSADANKGFGRLSYEAAVPNGYYTISAYAFTNGTTSFVAGDKAAAIANTGKYEAVALDSVMITNGKMNFGLDLQGAGWVGITNIELAFTAAIPDSILYGAQRDAFVARAQEFGAFVEGNASLTMMSGIKGTYAWPLFEVIDPLVADIDNVTDMALLDSMVTAMDEATAAMKQAVVVYEEYSAIVSLFWDAADNSTALNQDVADARDLALMNSNYTGMNAATVEALEAAVVEIQNAYLAYVTNAIAKDNYLFDVTFLLAAADCANKDGWTTEGAVGAMSGQHWSGDNSNNYLEPCDWGATSWEASLSQTVSLPNGRYSVKAAGRASAGVTLTLHANENSVAIPAVGDVGGTIATDGTEWADVATGIAAGKTFANGNAGRGWNYVSVDAEVTEGTLTVAAKGVSTTQYQWASVDDFKLYCLGVPVENGIENIETVKNAVIYTISGKRVEGNVKSLEKGIYIVNGKKVLVK